MGLDLERDAAAAIPRQRPGRRAWPVIASPREVRDRRGDLPTRSWTVALTVQDHPDDVARAVSSVLRHLPADGEVLILDQSSAVESAARIHALAGEDARVRAIFADRDLGEGAGRNALLRAARGAYLLQLDASVELTGHLLDALEEALRPTRTAFAGPWGLRTDDLKDFREVTSGDVEAIQGYCLASRRETVLALGGFDERFRFYRNLDIALSLAARERGLDLVAVGEGLAVRHEHRAWEALPEAEREKRSRRNFDRVYRRFHESAVMLGNRVPHTH
ncbi:MAG: glycosyltransferase [Chloroflexi bacterium]|nr:glycosyltransferase [Chloroflexota bacterium]